MPNIKEMKNELVNMSLKLYNEKLIVGTWGNLSARINYKNKNAFLVTPSGMNYEKTKPEDIVLVDEVGNILDGIRKPTSELKVHLAIYKNRKDVNAVFHTHSTFATACAVSGLSIPMMVEDMVMHIGGEIKVAEYAMTGTEELAQNAVKALQDRNGILLKNHGAIGAGKNMEEAFKSCVLIEKSAQIFIYSKMLGNLDLLNLEDANIMIDKYRNSYGQ